MSETTLTPTSTGTYNSWVVFTGDKVSNVLNYDSTFVYGTPTLYQSWNLTGQSAIPSTATIISVRVVYIHKEEVNAHTMSMNSFVYLGGSETHNGTVVPGAAYVTTTDYEVARPGGGNWARADVDSMQVGVRGTGTGDTHALYCNQIYVVVEWAVGTQSSCLTETVSGGVIEQITAPIIAASPTYVHGAGAVINETTGQYDMPIVIRDAIDGQQGVGKLSANSGQLVVYRAILEGTNARVPKVAAVKNIRNCGRVYPHYDSNKTGSIFLAGLGAADPDRGLFTRCSSFTLNSFDDNTSFTDITSYVCQDPGISITRGLRGTSPDDRLAAPGTCTFEMDNSEFSVGGTLGGLSPDATSPDGPGATISDLKVGAQVKVSVVSGGSIYIFRGTIDSLTPVPGKYRERRLRVECSDPVRQIDEASTRTMGITTEASASSALLSLLDRVPLGPGGENFNSLFTSTTYTPRLTMDFAFDRAYDEKTSIASEIVKVLKSINAYMYYSPDDNAMRVVTGDELRNKDAAQVYTENDLAGANIEHRRRDAINQVKVKVYPRTVDSAATTVLFTLSDKPLIQPGETLEFDAGYRDPDGLSSRVGGTSMVIPVASTDYTFYTAQDSGGQDKTSQLKVTTNFGGSGASISIYNPGPTAGYLRKFQLRGKGVYSQEPVLVNLTDDSKVAEYGLRELVYDMPYETSTKSARRIATRLLEAYGSTRTFIESVTLNLNESDVFYNLLTYDIGEKIGLTETVSALIATNYWTLGTSALSAAHMYPLELYHIANIDFRIRPGRFLVAKVDLLPSSFVL